MDEMRPLYFFDSDEQVLAKFRGVTRKNRKVSFCFSKDVVPAVKNGLSKWLRSRRTLEEEDLLEVLQGRHSQQVVF